MARIDELRTFCLVIEQKSFSRAADILYLSQPAVSMQIKSLENEYSDKLLHRDGREILPTESGKHVYDYACKVVDLERRSKQKIRELRDRISGRLNITSSSGPGEWLLPRLLATFKEEHSDTDINLHVGDSSEVIGDILKYRYELGFVGISRRDSHLQFDPFIHDELVLVTHPGHPWVDKSEVTLNDVRREPLILQQYGSGATTHLSEEINKNGLNIHDFNIVMELGLQESTKTAVESGFGVTIISKLGIIQEINSGKLVEVPIKDIKMYRNYYILYLKTEPLTKLAENFVYYAQKAVSAILPDEFLLER